MLPSMQLKALVLPRYGGSQVAPLVEPCFAEQRCRGSSTLARHQCLVGGAFFLAAAAFSAGQRCRQRTCRSIIQRAARKGRRGSAGRSGSGGLVEAAYVSLEDFFHAESLSSQHEEELQPVLESLAMGGVGVIPTDTHNAYITTISSKQGIRRIYDLKGLASDERKPLSLLCSDLSMAADYCDLAALPRKWFQILRSCLPGPYTFILRASAEVPRVVLEHKTHTRVWKRREVGIRIPDNTLVRHVAEEMEEPLLSSSACDDTGVIWDTQRHKVDFVVAAEDQGGMMNDVPSEDRVSTVLDLTMEEPVLRRQGLGDVSAFEDLVVL
eukprot:TRINITY_DN8659_c0_g1_i2.p1 TRINITY_DN8659_c0_g1~~TRINITY_DN8659_c0_g1_i2.p1  ORF type:complete len:325 (-),score=69.67 TRINITY_DN8659_c0_g1_i2:76-1050(-)